jgi:ceramide synthetase
MNNFPCVFRLLSKGLEEEKRRKLHENLWYGIWHTFSCVSGIAILMGQEWLYDLFLHGDNTTLLCEFPQYAEEMNAKTYYLVELSFWISCCIYLFFETRRKDRIEMIVHHVSTVTLVLYSYYYGFTRSGLLIMSLHDVGDVFLYLAKASQYRRFQNMADGLFAMFAITFFIPRLIILPIWVTYPLIAVFNFPGYEQYWYPITSNTPRYSLSSMISLLCVLICLHIMWGATIARMIAKTFTSKKSATDDGDPRSDDEQGETSNYGSTTESRDDSSVHCGSRKYHEGSISIDKKRR